MKKKLIASCRVRPYTSGAAIDRQNFGSAVLGLKVAAATGSPTAATLKLALTESDTSSGTFAAVSDKQALIGGLLDADGAVTMDIPVTGSEAQIGIDLTGANPTPQYAGQTMVSHIMDQGFLQYNMGYATALSVLLLLLILLVSQLANKFFAERD